MSIKFLIVDDSKAMQTIVQRILANAGYRDCEFNFANDGEEALKTMGDWQPDMVLLDWHMPRMTGIEVLTEAKKLKLTPKIGFITAEKNKTSIKRALDSGALFVVNKPFTVEKLKESLIPALAGTSVATVEEVQRQELIFPSPSAISTLLSTITGSKIKVEKVNTLPVSQLQLPSTLALYGDRDKNVRAIQVLEADTSDKLAELFASSVFAGEAFDDKLLAKALIKALSILAVCFYTTESSQELRLVKTYNMSQLIKKVEKMDSVPDNERLDLKFSFDDGSFGYSFICMETGGKL